MMQPTAESMMNLLSREEELIPELKAYIFQPSWGGFGIHHPLVVEPMVDRKRCGRVNKMYHMKIEKLQEARRMKDFQLYVWLYERPYRIQGFLKIQRSLKDEEYWELLGAIWSDSENIFENTRRWRSLLDRKRSGKELFMSEEERQQFDALPETLTIYRGYSSHLKLGLSWTLDQDKAEWFAKRFNDGPTKPPMLLTGTIQKHKCFAYLTERGEEEIIVVRPKDIEDMTAKQLTAR